MRVRLRPVFHGGTGVLLFRDDQIIAQRPCLAGVAYFVLGAELAHHENGGERVSADLFSRVWHDWRLASALDCGAPAARIFDCHALEYEGYFQVEHSQYAGVASVVGAGH